VYLRKLVFVPKNAQEKNITMLWEYPSQINEALLDIDYYLEANKPTLKYKAYEVIKH